MNDFKIFQGTVDSGIVMAAIEITVLAGGAILIVVGGAGYYLYRKLGRWVRSRRRSVENASIRQVDVSAKNKKKQRKRRRSSKR